MYTSTDIGAELSIYQLLHTFTLGLETLQLRSGIQIDSVSKNELSIIIVIMCHMTMWHYIHK